MIDWNKKYVLTPDELSEVFWQGYQYAFNEMQKKKDVAVDFYAEFFEDIVKNKELKLKEE